MKEKNNDLNLLFCPCIFLRRFQSCSTLIIDWLIQRNYCFFQFWDNSGYDKHGANELYKEYPRLTENIPKIRMKTFPFNYNVLEYLYELSQNIQVIKSKGTGFKTLLQVQNYTFANLRA